MKIPQQMNLRLFSRGDPEKWYPRPRRDWTLILAGAFVVSAAVTIIHLSLFVYLLSHETFSSAETGLAGNASSLDQKALKDITARFAIHSEETKKLLSGPLDLRDPAAPRIIR